LFDENVIDQDQTTSGYGRYGSVATARCGTIPNGRRCALASAIKGHTLAQLDTYLEMFGAKAKANGVFVHWATDAAEDNAIVADVLTRRGAKTLVKTTSFGHTLWLSQDCSAAA
jgi:L-lactate utilization protein LutB